MIPLYWNRRLTRLESGLVCAVCAVIIALFLERTLSYMELAERTAMEVTVQHVNAALQIQRAAELLQGRASSNSQNPFELARMRVPRVHPDLNDPKRLAELERGYWVFERSGAQLIYLPQLHRRLQSDDGLVRFRLERARGAPYSLVPAVEYSWD
jgi:hypothetical protein